MPDADDPPSAGGDDPSTGDDPTTIRSLAVSPEDVVDAFVYTRENPATAVLRVTPPFHGRMRARLHVYHRDDAAVTGAIHLDPARLLREDAVAAYPSLEERRADEPESEGAARTREARAAAVDRWRERARASLREEVVVETADGTRAIDLKRLG